MAAAGGVDEHDGEIVERGVGHGVFGDGGGVFAVAFFEEFDASSAFPGGELFEVTSVDAELFDGARAEGVTGGDEDFEVIL